MVRRALLLSAILAGCFVLAAAPQGTKLKIVSGLLSQKSLVRQSTYGRVRDHRSTTIREVISVLEMQHTDRSFYGSLHLAIKSLGKLRAKEAVRPLTEHLLFVPEHFDTGEDIPSEAYRVAAVALVEIGQPCIWLMLQRIRNSDVEEERKLAAWVIMEIEGKEQATNRLSRAAKSVQRGKERFELAREFVETYEPIFEHPDKVKEKKLLREG